jgi:protease IV
MKPAYRVHASLALALIVAATLTTVGGLRADPQIPSYRSETEFMLTSPGAFEWEGCGFSNPATLTYVTAPDLLFAWRGSVSASSDLSKWGGFAVMPGLGFGAIHEKQPHGGLTDYRISLAQGDRRVGFGAAYGWTRGNAGGVDRASTIGLGTLVRPATCLSVGLSGRLATKGDEKEGVLDVGIRPLGQDAVTIFGDYALEHGRTMKDGDWSTGAALKVLPGIRVTGRYFGGTDGHAFTAGLSLDLGRIGVASQAHYDNRQHRAYNTYRVRTGADKPNVIDTHIMPGRKYLDLDLLGPVKYQRYRIFDESQTLADLLSTIEAAKHDPRVSGIAINTSGMQAGREVAWELREKLRDFRSTGKHVVIFIDAGGIDAYHFASVADKIVLDPAGVLTLEGFLMGRTYLKGMLAKVGLAFDEWRFFTYKSADEAFSRESMSEADREQRQRLVDEYYNLARSEICASRHISTGEFDRLVNEQPILLPEEALKLGLVDTLARADAFKDVVKGLEGSRKAIVGPGVLGLSPASLAGYGAPADDRWGERPEIAVVYAIGECAMDTGIRARSLSKVVDAVAGDARIKAVVFRVDSPGGDATASDVVADALKRCKAKKPVIVSQGAVAASGGYWISMYGTRIVAAPQTITGSIGVIGGWFYNAGLKEKLGMASDYVKAGAHADLGFGPTVPLIGATIPDRNLDDAEHALMEHMIKTFYKDFVTKVAAGRSMKYEDVDKIGQGRVWPGVDGKQNGLIDDLGGLEIAIMLAKEKAGIAPDEEVKLVELPTPMLFDTSFLKLKLIGFAEHVGAANLLGVTPSSAGAEAGTVIEDLRFRLDHNGRPLPILPLDDMDMAIEAQGVER